MSAPPAADDPSVRTTAVCAGLILALAVALRAWAFDLYAMHHPDEVFQYLEPAHRLVFGYGLKPWEYRYGMRSWLVPLALSGPMRLGAWLAPGGLAYLWAPKLAAALFCLLPVPAAYAIGAQRSRWHGLAAMWVAAVWFEQVYFSVHILTEVFAVVFFLCAAALAAPGASPRRMAAAGALLGLAFVMRFHYAPALAVFAALTCRLELRRAWLPMAAGGLLALALSGGVDLVFGQPPFGWIVENFRQNILHNRAAAYGTDGPFAYLTDLAVQWRFVLPAVALLTLPTVRSHGALFWSAWANLLVHMAISHKEYRFVWLSASVLVLLAAIGSIDVLRTLAVRRGWRGPARAAAMGVLALAWAAASGALAAEQPMRGLWRAFDPELRLTTDAAKVKPAICGLALHRVLPWYAGGATYLHRPIPWYLTDWRSQEAMTPAQFAAASPAFDAVITPLPDARDLPPGYAKILCRGRGSLDPAAAPTCLYVRPGGCDPRTADRWRVEAVLLRHDS